MQGDLHWCHFVPYIFDDLAFSLIAVDFSNIIILLEGILVAFHYSFSFYSDSADMHTDHVFMYGKFSILSGVRGHQCTHIFFSLRAT